MRKNILLLLLLMKSFSGQGQDFVFKTKFDDAVPVLNVGTFHMGYTPDAHKTEFDEHNAENVRKVHEIAAMIAEFKPTVIVVEALPANQEHLQKKYYEYVQNPTMEFENPNEIQLLAYEVGRLSSTKRIYGIDYKEGYNYMIYSSLTGKVDSLTYLRYGQMMSQNEAEYRKAVPNADKLLEMLRAINNPHYLDFLINVNADMLTYVSTQGKAEGAEEAAKFYHRNLVMYSNLNQIPLTSEDRVFILMGAAHTAFFNEWVKRSPKYIQVDVFDYL